MKALVLGLLFTVLPSAAVGQPRYVVEITVGDFMSMNGDTRVGYLAGVSSATADRVHCSVVTSMREDDAALITRYSTGRLRASDNMLKAWYALQIERGCQVRW